MPRTPREAGAVTLEYFRSANLQVDRKSDRSPVTEADRRSERLLRDRIANEFPGDAILGEEFGETPGDSGFRWILDPIDGTKSFIHGVPLYGTLVGVEFEERSQVGVIEIPALDERAWAAAGQGAWYQRGEGPPTPAVVSDCRELSEAALLTSEVEGFALVDRWDTLHKLQAEAGLVRTWGDCYGYLLLVSGRADAMVDPRMHVWDAAALQPILEEAGGTFTDWEGQPSIHSGNGVATNGHLLEQVLEITRSAK